LDYCSNSDLPEDPDSEIIDIGNQLDCCTEGEFMTGGAIYSAHPEVVGMDDKDNVCLEERMASLEASPERIVTSKWIISEIYLANTRKEQAGICSGNFTGN
jgi:hypothetical protein